MKFFNHQGLSAQQQAILPIAAFTATGDITSLSTALNAGLDGGLTISDCKEILIQMYAYAGFPRSLNALAALMNVLNDRKRDGIDDSVGSVPDDLPAASEVLSIGTANQSKLAGAPVQGPLFEFAPTMNQFLRAHLFGDIFARDNFDWQSRELATVGALAAMDGVGSQLQAHVRICMNIGLTEGQLLCAAEVLAHNVGAEASQRVRDSLGK